MYYNHQIYNFISKRSVSLTRIDAALASLCGALITWWKEITACSEQKLHKNVKSCRTRGFQNFFWDPWWCMEFSFRFFVCAYWSKQIIVPMFASTSKYLKQLLVSNYVSWCSHTISVVAWSELQQFRLHKNIARVTMHKIMQYFCNTIKQKSKWNIIERIANERTKKKSSASRIEPM